LAVGELEQGSSVSFGGVLAEHLVEAPTAGEQMKRLVEDEERFGKSVDDRQREGLRLCTIGKLLHWIVLR
jgi:hypothetical protein